MALMYFQPYTARKRARKRYAMPWKMSCATIIWVERSASSVVAARASHTTRKAKRSALDAMYAK